MQDHHPLTPMALAALVGMVPATVLLFSVLPLRRAILAAFFGGWLFLPQNTGVLVPGVLPDYDRQTAIMGSVLFCVVLFDPWRLASFRPRLFDAPLIALCSVPLFSSLANGLGAYDGLAQSFARAIQWAVVYLLGRVYFADWEGLRQLAVGFFLAGLVYVPLCVIEMLLSPQLHNLVYGFHQHSFAQTFRLGGWRPMVFLDHGLAVGMWMAGASLLGVWLWLGGALRRLGGAALPLLVILLAVTALCRSLAALAFLAAGLGALLLGRSARSAWPVILLTLIPILYMGARSSGAWSGDGLVALIEQVVNPARAQSVEYRFQNEDLLTERAFQRPLLGWSGWGRSHVQGDAGQQVTIADGFWIIVLGLNGLVGLAAFTLVFLLPVWSLLYYVPAARWGEPLVAPAAALVVLMAVKMSDNLLNAMFNPVLVLALGGLVGLTASLARRAPAPAAAPRRLVPPAGVLHVSQDALTVQAWNRWGPDAYRRREAIVQDGLQELGTDAASPLGRALRRVVLSISPEQLEAFVPLPSSDKVSTVRASGALAVEEEREGPVGPS